MNIVIVGRGWIGQKMAGVLAGHNVKLLSHETVFDYLEARVPRPITDWVINCAGFTGVPNVDACENQKSRTIEANSVFPMKLLDCCTRWQTRFAHFSSGCIFQGGPFAEEDKPNFDGSVYSASKLVSDQELVKYAMVLRVRMPFDGSWHPKNLLMKLSQYALSSKILDGLNSLTNIDEACLSVKKLVESNAPNGPYHLVNEGPLWTHEIMELMKTPSSYWDKEEFYRKFPAVRSECVLTSKTPLSDTRESILKAIDNMKMKIAV